MQLLFEGFGFESVLYKTTQCMSVQLTCDFEYMSFATQGYTFHEFVIFCKRTVEQMYNMLFFNQNVFGASVFQRNHFCHFIVDYKLYAVTTF